MNRLCACVGLLVLTPLVLSDDICRLAYELNIQKLKILCEEETMVESVLQKRAPSPFLRFGRGSSTLDLLDYYARNRRGPNYIRFGRSVDSVHEDENSADKDTSGETTKRFRRSMENAAFTRRKRDVTRAAEEKKELRFGKKDGSEEAEKRFIRFGRDKGEDDKRFIRFGRNNDEKRRFIRFGRDKEDEHENIIDEDKRLMRFGRGPFMRFGKRGPFIRFGRDDVEKRGPFMRFGRRFIRFGKRPVGFGENDGDTEIDDDKQNKFTRFDSEDGALLNDKRSLKFGKKDDISKLQAEKKSGS